jgi:uncharacterized membrane protein YphA (DoxX/SURF4 family)
MRNWLLHPRASWLVRVVLGLVFMAAALSKISDPPGFAKAIWAYQLFPTWSLHPIALVLPWLEWFCGLALCLGVWIRAAALWVGGLLLAFCLALSVNLVRGQVVDCGCFGASAPRTEAQRLADMRWTLLRDAALLLMAIQVVVVSANQVDHSES